MENQENSEETSKVCLSGSGITSKIVNTTSSTLQAPNSSLFLDNSTKIRVNVRESNIRVQNSSHLLINGAKNEISGDNLTNSNIYGENNTISARDTSDFVLSGSDNICDMADETNPTIFGNGNQVISEGNRDLLVSGFMNRVVAEHTEALEVQGSQNRVVAANARNNKITGQFNQVSIRHTSISHQLKRRSTSVGQIPENQVYFSGSPVNCYTYAGITFQSPQPSQTFLPESSVNSVEEKMKLMSVRLVIPQLSLYYIDRVSIRRNRYIIGIFYVQVNTLEKQISEGVSSQITVQILTDNLDEGSFTSTIGEKGNYALVSGTKCGGMQTLRLVGTRVSKLSGCEPSHDNLFVIELDPEWRNREEIEVGLFNENAEEM